MLYLAVAMLLQAPTPGPGIVRSLTLTLTEEKGSGIESLALDDVAVLENGVAREVVRLEPDRRPLTLAVLVDSSQDVDTSFRLNVVDAVTAFLRRLPQGSRYCVWTTGDRPTKVVDFTDDVAAAGRALKRTYPQGGNRLLDALVEASKDLVAREGERMAVAVVTGLGVGFTNYDRRQVVDLARRDNLMFMSVQFEVERRSEEAGEVPRADYEYVLSTLASRSGGLNESTLSAMGVDSALQKISSALKGQYRLSYSTLPEMKERKVEVKLARPGVKVRVGPGRPQDR